ncbi:alpha/beta hydrolase [Nocardia pseudovaccinii]|uniref:alpha/beta hydrolase n=1 Tax=Nocardia pseudovaccinii TaxID=189540 RepID=UPI003D8ABD7F
MTIGAMVFRRTMFSAAIVAALVPATLVACTSTSSPTPTLNWRSCQENDGFDCATVTVPIDWADRDGATIDIAVIRDKADDPARKVGTLVALPGGPGSSGVDDLLKGGRFSPELRARFDIVSLDPRGVQRSHPLRCDGGLAAHRPNMVPDLGGRLDEIRSYARDFAASCREHTGALVDHLDAVSVARDVEALRVALGVDRFSVYSRSYGTMFAQAYAELFPQRLRALLMDSVDDHSLDGRGFFATEARGGQDAFDEFAAWCERDRTCALHGTDVHRIYGDLFDRAAQGTLHDSADPNRAMGPIDLSIKVTQRLYRPDWPGLTVDLQALAAQPATPVQSAAVQRSGRPAATPEAFVCADWKFDIADQDDWIRQWHEQNAAAPTLRAHFAWAAGTLCSAWPTAAQNPPHRPRIDGAPPILVINGRHDPAAPYEWATRVAAQIPNSTLLTYDGWGHGSYDRTPCTTNAADRYLIDLVIPAPSTHCAAA